MERIAAYWHSLTPGHFLIAAGFFLISLLISFGAIVLVLVNIPADYFSPHHTRQFLTGRSKPIRWTALILKNILGAFLVGLGVVLSLPGVPGQGFLTILLGLIMLDIPGKRPLEAKIVARPTILAAANKIRARFDKPPLTLN